MIRRLAVLVMLFAAAFSSLESVVGLVRDGEVHHESRAAAATHSSMSHGEHGHEDGSQHGPEHEHGTPADHCTHQHSCCTASPGPRLAIATTETSEVFPGGPSWFDHSPEPSLRPPRA